MIAYFADGPLNGQTRELPDFTWRYRVPLVTKMEDWGPNYWEGSNAFTEVTESNPSLRVGYYEPVSAFLKTGARIYVFQGVE